MKWEYLIVAAEGLALHDPNGHWVQDQMGSFFGGSRDIGLNVLGSQGWELVVIDQDNQYVFKRSKQE